MLSEHTDTHDKKLYDLKATRSAEETQYLVYGKKLGVIGHFRNGTRYVGQSAP